MTETPSSPTDPADDDLLASLYLDGEATAEERSKVEGDPGLMARVEAFRSMANEMSEIASPPDLSRLHIAAALDLFDEQQTGSRVDQSTVTSLTDRRDQKRSRGLPSWLGVAAAVALVAGGLGFASTLGGNSDDASSADVAMESSDDVSASSTNRETEELFADDADVAAEGGAALGAADAETQADAMEEEMADEAMPATTIAADQAMEDAGDAATDDVAVGPSPIILDGLDATTATEYFELLRDEPLLPIAESPCAGSPVVEELGDVDGFLPVVFQGDLASLIVQEGEALSVLIVGPTCQVVLD